MGARIAPALVGHRDATTHRLFIGPMPQNWAIKTKGRPWFRQPRKKDVDSSARSFTADPNTIGSPMVDDTAAPSDTEPADDGPKDEPKRTSLAVKPSGDTAFFTARTHLDSSPASEFPPLLEDPETEPEGSEDSKESVAELPNLRALPRRDKGKAPMRSSPDSFHRIRTRGPENRPSTPVPDQT